jgi:hypothetical protein
MSFIRVDHAKRLGDKDAYRKQRQLRTGRLVHQRDHLGLLRVRSCHMAGVLRSSGLPLSLRRFLGFGLGADLALRHLRLGCNGGARRQHRTPRRPTGAGGRVASACKPLVSIDDALNAVQPLGAPGCIIFRRHLTARGLPLFGRRDRRPQGFPLGANSPASREASPCSVETSAWNMRARPLHPLELVASCNIMSARMALRCRSCLLDGEVVICGADGIAFFKRLRESKRGKGERSGSPSTRSNTTGRLAPRADRGTQKPRWKELRHRARVLGR